MIGQREVLLGDVASIDRLSIDPSAIPSDTLYIGLENIERGGRLANITSVGQAGVNSLKYRFTASHVLFGKLRPYLAKISRPDFEGICSTDILPIRPGPELDRNYLYHFLIQPDIISLASSKATGANLPRLNPKTLANFRITLVSLPEQRRLADLLDRIDTLRAKRREATALLDDLSRSIFLHMFSAAPHQWPLVTVEDVAAEGSSSIRTGPFGSQLLHEEFVDSGIAVLGIDNAVTNEFRWSGRRYITEQKYRQLTRYTVHPGDVLITIMGTCGRCAIIPDGMPVAINTKHLCCITLNQDKCLPEFLHSAFLMHPGVRDYLHRTAKGAIMSGLNMRIIKALPMHLPPIEIQRTYATKLRALQVLKAQHLAHLAELDALFLTLQHQVFHGEI